MQGGDQKQAGGGAELGIAGGQGECGIESVLEPRGDLLEVGAKAIPGFGRAGIHDGDLNLRGDEEPLDLGHGGGQPLPLIHAQGFEDRMRQVIGAAVELGQFGAPGGGEAGGAHPGVAVGRGDLDQPGALQCAQQPAEIPRVQAQARPQFADVAAAVPDFPQHPRLPEGAVPGEVFALQDSYPLRDGAVEAAQAIDQGIGHLSDFSQRKPRCLRCVMGERHSRRRTYPQGRVRDRLRLGSYRRGDRPGTRQGQSVPGRR
ncbi:Uncharacterised protein [Mycobacteroides abscessus subsp. abscessus]|nr:Uncharacterised protein [Mycobacteroides abscessus subsp. abscessus]